MLEMMTMMAGDRRNGASWTVCLAAVLLCHAAVSGEDEMKSALLRHPVMPVNALNANQLKAEVDPVLDRGIPYLLDLVPDRNGVRFCDCPNCDQGAQAGQLVWNGLRDPDRVHCRFCGHTYPSETFPMSETISFRNRRGKQVEWRCYRSTGGEPHYFAARARYDAKQYLAKFVLTLANLYLATAEDRYADAGAALLYRLSQNYAGWVFVNDRPAGKDGPLPDAAPPYPYWGGIWSRWFYADAPPAVAWAYDRLYASGAFERLSATPGVEVRRAVEQDMLHASITFIRSYKEYYSNMSPGIYTSLILYGRILNEPEYVHDGLSRATDLLRQRFFLDGMWKEGTVSYHRQTVGWLSRVFDIARGYSDPPGYAHPDTLTRFDDLDIARDIPFVNKTVNASKALVFPNQRIVPVHDAWAHSTHTPTETNAPVLLTGMGHARLARRDGPNAMQVHLHFSGAHGHAHRDSLSIILWAQGRELLSDIGYTHSAWRLWTSVTPSHNTVLVDSQDQRASGRGGDLQLFAPLTDNVQLVEAQDLDAYRAQTTEYRRRLILIGTSPEHAYIVDIFRVAGGRQHDWIVHGSPEHDQTVETSLVTVPDQQSMLGPGVEFRLPRSEGDPGSFPADVSKGLAFLDSAANAQANSNWSATFRFKQGAEPCLRTTMLLQQKATVHLVSAPSIRRAQENDADLATFRMPGILVRRAADAEALTSVFVAVHEPYRGETFVRSARLLPLDSDESGVARTVALEVVHENGTDLIMSSPVPRPATTRLKHGGTTFSCDGQFGLLRVREQAADSACLLGGTSLGYGTNLQLRAEQAAFEGTIREVRRDPSRPYYALCVDTESQLLPGSALSYAIVTHGDGSTHGFKAVGMSREPSGVVLKLADDPGFTVEPDGTTRFIYYPQNTVKGANRVRIPTTVTFARHPGRF